MREIKFRAWYRGKMYHFVEHHSYPDGSSGVNCLGESMERMFSPGDEVTLMQYTGLLDYSGKGIYEGDIIRCQYAEDRGPRFVDVVEWSNCEFTIGTYGLGEIEAEEIIGNIYENSNLLEGDTHA